jgi:flagellar basal body-associated protein FliL
MKKKKLMMILPVVLLLAGAGAYFTVLKPKPAAAAAAPKPKIEGEIFPIEDEFVFNLAGGRYGKVSVALVFSEKQPPELTPAGAHGAGGGELVQMEAVRAVITDALTGLAADDFIVRDRRHHVVESVIKDLNTKTDVKVTEVFFTDVVVQ